MQDPTRCTNRERRPRRDVGVKSPPTQPMMTTAMTMTTRVSLRAYPFRQSERAFRTLRARARYQRPRWHGRLLGTPTRSCHHRAGSAPPRHSCRLIHRTRPCHTTTRRRIIRSICSPSRRCTRTPRRFASLGKRAGHRRAATTARMATTTARRSGRGCHRSPQRRGAPKVKPCSMDGKRTTPTRHPTLCRVAGPRQEGASEAEREPPTASRHHAAGRCICAIQRAAGRRAWPRFRVHRPAALVCGSSSTGKPRPRRQWRRWEETPSAGTHMLHRC